MIEVNFILDRCLRRESHPCVCKPRGLAAWFTTFLIRSLDLGVLASHFVNNTDGSVLRIRVVCEQDAEAIISSFDEKLPNWQMDRDEALPVEDLDAQSALFDSLLRHEYGNGSGTIGTGSQRVQVATSISSTHGDRLQRYQPTTNLTTASLRPKV